MDPRIREDDKVGNCVGNPVGFLSTQLSPKKRRNLNKSADLARSAQAKKLAKNDAHSQGELPMSIRRSLTADGAERYWQWQILRCKPCVSRIDFDAMLETVCVYPQLCVQQIRS